MNNTINKCLICDGSLVKSVKSNFYQYYTCDSCKTSQLISFPSQEELEMLYNKFHLSDEEGGSYDWIEERIKADFPKKIELVKEHTKYSTSNLLDVGCGKGFFVESCNKNKIDAIGIDVSKSGVDYAVTKLKVQAEQVDIVNFSKRIEHQNSYDVITLWATIEHLPNPKVVINAIYNCLKPGGLFFIDTGLGNDRFEKFLSGHSQWYDAPQHLFVYSVEGLKNLLSNAGFNILTVDKNFERSYLRRIIKFIRHFVICIGSFIILRPVLGKTGFDAMQKESKWPIGKLLQITAKKIK
jgi:SAM-dependent methyltransferase